MVKNTEVYLLYTDLISSRTIDDKKVLQQQTDIFLAAYNASEEGTRFNGSKLTTWKGIDEIAGLVSSPWQGIEALKALNEQVSPYKFRGVVVQAQIDRLPNEGERVADVNGKVFVDASEAMKTIKMQQEQFLFTGNEDGNAMMLTNYFRLIDMVKAQWTKAQADIYNLYTGDRTQVDIAGQLNITPQAVSKTLNIIAGEKVKKLEAEFKQWMQQTFKTLPG